MRREQRKLSATQKLLELIRAEDGESSAGVGGESFDAAAPVTAGRQRQLSLFKRWRRSSWNLSALGPLVRVPGRAIVTVGLSLRPTSIEIAVASGPSAREGRLLKHACYPVEIAESPPSSSHDISWLVAEPFRAALQQALQEVATGPRGRFRPRIWVAIPSWHLEINQLTIPRVPAGGVANAVLWAARKNIEGFDPTAGIIDFTLHPESGKGGERLVTVYLAPGKLVTALRELFAELGFPLTGLTTTVAAVENLRTQGRLPGWLQCFSHLQVEEQQSFISLFQKQRLEFSRDIKTGLLSILEGHETSPSIAELPPAAIAEAVADPGAETKSIPESLAEADSILELELESDEAGDVLAMATESSMAGEETGEEAGEEIGEEAGGEAEAVTRPAVGEGAEPDFDPRALSRLVRQLERTFDYCQSKLGVPRPAHLYVASHTQLGPAFREYIANELAMPCSVLDPFVEEAAGKDKFPPPAHPHQRQLLATAVGLAFADSQYTQNFLQTYPDKEKLRQSLRVNNLIVGLFIALTVGLAGFYFHQQATLGELQEQIAGKRQQLAQYPDNIFAEERLPALAAAISRQRRNLVNDARHLYPLTLIGEIQQRLPAGIGLLEITAHPAEPESHLTEVVVRGLIEEQGVEGELLLTRFLRRLSHSGLVRDAEITGRKDMALETGEVLFFEMRLAPHPLANASAENGEL